MTGTSLIATMAAEQGMDPVQYVRTLRATVMPSKHTEEQFAAFMLVAHKYGLNPITKEIYAYPARNGGITPVLSIDGWINLVNSHPQCDGFEVKLTDKDGKLHSGTCTMFRKDRSHPIVVTEFYDEVYRNTDPWNGMPRRMMRHKCFKECARLAFGFALKDEDEARDIARTVDTIEAEIAPPETTVAALDQFAAEPVESGGAAWSVASTGGDEATAAGTANEAAVADEPEVDDQPKADDRQEMINKLFRMTREPGPSEPQGKLETLDITRTMLLDLYPQQADFVREATTTIAKVIKGELPPRKARVYLEGMIK